MFAAAIVGGIGSPIGAVIGGYVIAFSEITLTYAYKKFFIYLLPENLEPSGLMQVLSTDYKFAISFIISLARSNILSSNPAILNSNPPLLHFKENSNSANSAK